MNATATNRIDRDQVIAFSRILPAFPRVISEIIETLEDADASLQLLTGPTGDRT